MENYSSSLDESLIIAYLQTHYIVPSKHICIQIGQQTPPLDELLEQNHAQNWSFITSVNPYSQPTERPENQKRLSQLRSTLKKANYVFFDALGQDPQQIWPAEPSFLVLDLHLAKAKEIAAKFEQNAFVYGQKNQPADLILLR